MEIQANQETLEVSFEIPLTRPTGKVRIKERNSIHEYGKPFASKQNRFHSDNYVEWQVSYDAPFEGQLSTTEEVVFVNSKGKQKSLYELSKALYYFYHWNVISDSELLNLAKSIEIIENKFLDSGPEAQIHRTSPVSEEINGLSFLRMILNYPQLIYEFQPDGYIAEVTIREKQNAVGIQPMLYFCFPISELASAGSKLIGRTAKTNETASFTLSPDKKSIILDMFKIFGILSQSHNEDVLSILSSTIQSKRLIEVK